MLVSPSGQTMIPRRNCYRGSSCSRRRTAVRLPGGRLLWYGIAKASVVSFFFLLGVSVWSTHSMERFQQDVGQAEAQQAELMNANIILRAQKAQLFSPQAVEQLAMQQLALHFPESGQYRKF